MQGTFSSVVTVPVWLQASGHVQQLLEKYIGKPFRNDARFTQGISRMTESDVHRGLDWLDTRFYLIRCEDEALPNLDWVISKAEVAVLRSA